MAAGLEGSAGADKESNGDQDQDGSGFDLDHKNSIAKGILDSVAMITTAPL